MKITLFVYLFKKIYKICDITRKRILFEDEFDIFFDKFESFHIPKSLVYVTNAYFLQPFTKALINSTIYRVNVIRNMYQKSGILKSKLLFVSLELEPPDKEIIDYAW